MIGDLNLAEANELLKPLTMFVIGIVIYSVFIFNFYRFLARRKIFELDLEKHNTSRYSFLKKLVSGIIHFVKYVLFFPLFSFFWFSVLTVLLVLLAKKQPVENIMLVSIAVVSAIRITAYYTEELSRDLAKMLPFALLGVFLVDISYFSFSESIDALSQIPSMWHTLVYYLLFVILMEFILKVCYPVVSRFLPGNSKE